MRRQGMAGPAAAWLLLAAMAGAASGQARRALVVDGDAVTIQRDAYGVPHIFASTLRGLFYGNGYAIAEDRLGQMDLYRRSARGEMAALVGPSAVDADRETRIDGYTEAEREAQFARLPAELRTMLSAYADGVNACIEARKAAGSAAQPANCPVRFDPAALRPWRVTDSVAIGQMMARRFGGDEGGELRNMLILSFLRARYKQKAWRLFNDVAWRNDPSAPTTVPPSEGVGRRPVATHWADENGRPLGLPGAFDPTAARRAIAVLDQDARIAVASRLGLMTKWGSYAIAVSKARSASGHAMLVGGPQMGFRTPQIAHEVHLSGAGIDSIGMGFAGVPGVLIGHNRDLAWTTTTGVNDETDVFVETLDPADATRYRFRGAWCPMEKRTETIEVAGASPVTVEVCRTIHGPVVQWDRAHHLAYSRASTYRDRELGTFIAEARFNAARTIREFGAACAYVSTSHNWLCATRDGDIGYWFSGRTPIRDPRVDPRLPTPGDGTREWRGILPFSRQPQIINPRQGFLDNWNTKPAVWWDNYDTPVWGRVWHSARIDELLRAKPTVSAEDLRGILVDIGTNDYTAEVFLPLLNGALKKSAGALTASARQAARYLSAWDHHAVEGSVAATVFDAWLKQVRDDLFLRPFGFILLQGRGAFDLAMQPSYILHVLLGARSSVPVQFDYLAGKSPERAMAEALNRAVAKLAQKRGGDMAAWRWTRGDIKFAPLPPIPATDRGTYIQIVECGPTVQGVSICPPGQSEDPASPHFGDQREMAGWFFFKPMLTARAAIEGPAK